MFHSKSIKSPECKMHYTVLKAPVRKGGPDLYNECMIHSKNSVSSWLRFPAFITFFYFHFVSPSNDRSFGKASLQIQDSDRGI
jgi:hypothetical protein